MNYMISGKNIDVTEGLKQAVYDKLGRLEKFFNEDTNAQVTFSVEKERQKIEVTIPMKGHIIRAEQVSDDMYVSIDMVVEIIERQVTRYKKRIVDQEQDAAFFQNQFLEEDDDSDADDINIIRSKRFAVKPMYPEDACVQMELLGHNFYVFRNAETDEVNVVYKRKGNTYGLIEPEF
ncbi:MAG: ribosome-associated translation inhibitor RaiA [Eubacterium sp.]|nr:ribosome-associated translation inhibitor RaiA [Eubacterium sp.]